MNEIWKEIKNTRGIYWISSLGRVKSIARTTIRSGHKMKLKERVLRACANNYGYYYVCLHIGEDQKMKRVHRLVAQYFLGNCNDYPYVNHKDLDKSNNKLSNLEWCTQKHNIQHAHANRFIDTAKGSRSGQSKLMESDVEEMVTLFSSKTNKELGGMFNVTSSTIRSIRVGNTWSWLTKINQEE